MHLFEDLGLLRQIRTLQQVGLSQEALVVSAQATQAYPHSVPLWLLRLRSFCCHTREVSHSSLSELCRQARDTVPKEVCHYCNLKGLLRTMKLGMESIWVSLLPRLHTPSFFTLCAKKPGGGACWGWSLLRVEPAGGGALGVRLNIGDGSG